MAKYSFPKTEKEFHAWFSNFQQTFAANYKKYGFTSRDVTAVNKFFKSWQNSYNFWNGFNQFYAWYTKYHTTEFTNFKTFVAGFWNTIQNSSKFDGNWQRWFGVTAPKTTKRTTKSKSTNRKKTNSTGTTPTLFTEWKNGKLYLYVKPGTTGKPAWAKGCTVQYKTTGGTWKTVGKGTKTTFAHGFNGAKKVSYRACWYGTGKTSGWSKTSSYNWGTTKTGLKKAA